MGKQNNLEKIDQTPNIDPMTIIEGLRQEIYMMGSNDSEFDQINAIIQKWQNKEITGADAINQVRAIKDSKQDYH